MDETAIDRLREGYHQPIEDRQARWDRFQHWYAAPPKGEGLSLAQIRDRELELYGMTFSRERVRKILAGPRPGSIERLQISTLHARRRRLRRQLDHWSALTTQHAVARTADLAEQLAELNAELRRQEAEKARR